MVCVFLAPADYCRMARGVFIVTMRANVPRPPIVPRQECRASRPHVEDDVNRKVPARCAAAPRQATYLRAIPPRHRYPGDGAADSAFFGSMVTREPGRGRLVYVPL